MIMSVRAAKLVILWGSSDPYEAYSRLHSADKQKYLVVELKL